MMRHAHWSLRGIISGAVIVVALVDHAWAYDVATHRKITEAAFNNSVTINGPLFAEFGINDAVTSKTFPGSSGIASIAKVLMMDGSEFEDNGVRPINHFYNPWTGKGSIGFPAPDWALEESLIIPWQGYSYRDGRQAFFMALTQPHETDRDAAFGEMFETLGHVLHVIEDMAVPQHVRSDLHLSGSPWYSRYEKWTNDHLGTLFPLYPQYPKYPNVYSLTESRSLTAQRAFFNTADTTGVAVGKGLAEFTSRNFVSIGTNFTGTPPNLAASYPPLPDPHGAQITTIDAHNDSDLAPILPAGSLMDMIGTPISDTLFPEFSDTNPRTSTYSIYDQDLKIQGKQAVLALNALNFKAAHRLLMPRAVAYCAGMLDYFFRGNIDLAPDPAHTAKYVIRNFSAESMTGTFTFYYDAQDGTRKFLPGASWSNMSIAAADATTHAPGLSPPIMLIPPLDAQEVGKYMLVFRGDMGNEKQGDGSTGHSGYGAVVGRMVTAAPLEALYIAGMDAAGQVISLRVDETGTHLINGPDANGVPQQSHQFDPVSALVVAGVLNQRPYWWKQAHYLDGAATQYRIQAMASPGSGFVRDPVTQNLSSTFAYWIARSNDPAVGWFAFYVGAGGPNSGALDYTRTYTDSAGKTQTSSGNVPLPALPNYDPNTLTIGYDAFGFNNKLVVSEDGLTIYGLKTTTRVLSPPGSWVNAPYPHKITTTKYGISLHIALGATPVISAGVDEVTTVDEVDTLGGSYSESLTQPVCDFTNGFKSTDSVQDTSNTFVGVAPPGTERQWVGLFAGAVSSFTIDRSFLDTGHNEYHDDYTASGDTNWSPTGACNYQTTLTFSQHQGSDGMSTTSYHLKDGDVQSTQHGWRVTDDRYSPPTQIKDCHCHNFSCQGGCTYTPQTPVNTDTGAQTDSHIKDLAFVLRPDSAGVVFSTPIYVSPWKQLTFRGADITGKDFVGDVSPLGEIFFATTDLTMVIHEPLNGRMPQFARPGNMVKILAALWL